MSSINNELIRVQIKALVLLTKACSRPLVITTAWRSGIVFLTRIVKYIS